MSLHIIQNKMTLLKERLVTTLTITWFFLSVCQHMLHQMTIVREVFAAIFTIEYFTNHYVDREGSGTKLIWIQPLWFNFRLFMYLHMWNKIVFLPNDLLQCSQWCGFSLLCINMCCLRQLLVGKLLLHCSQQHSLQTMMLFVADSLKGWYCCAFAGFSWTFICEVSAYFIEDLSQCWQWCGFFPLYIAECCLRWEWL